MYLSTPPKKLRRRWIIQKATTGQGAETMKYVDSWFWPKISFWLHWTLVWVKIRRFSPLSKGVQTYHQGPRGECALSHTTPTQALSKRWCSEPWRQKVTFLLLPTLSCDHCYLASSHSGFEVVASLCLPNCPSNHFPWKSLITCQHCTKCFPLHIAMVCSAGGHLRQCHSCGPEFIIKKLVQARRHDGILLCLSKPSCPDLFTGSSTLSW